MKSSRQARPRVPQTQAHPLLSAHLARSLKKQRRRHRQALQRSRKRCSTKEVHDLRIETRRLLAHLDLLDALAPDPKLAKARRRLKREMKATAALRDAQVQTRLFDRLTRDGDYAQLASFGSYLKKRRKRHRKAAARKLQSAGLARPPARFERSLLGPPPSGRVDAGHRAAVGRALGRAYARVAARNRSAATDATALHRARVALKQFRYQAELLQPAVPGATKARLEPLRANQSVLGDIHDLDLFLARLEKFMAKGKVPQDHVQPLKAALLRRHAALMREQQRLAHTLPPKDWRRLLPLGPARRSPR